MLNAIQLGGIHFQPVNEDIKGFVKHHIIKLTVNMMIYMSCKIQMTSVNHIRLIKTMINWQRRNSIESNKHNTPFDS